MSYGPSASLTNELLGLMPASPDVYPHRLDLNAMAMFLLRLDEGIYRSASFLDDRILTPASQGAWLPFAAAAEIAQRITTQLPVHFIFHTGHVGSTLVSRLIDETGGVLSLREPLPLRTLAEAYDALGQSESLLSRADFDSLLALFVRLWARGYGGTSSIVVKATSSAGRIASALLQREPRSRAIYINVRAEPYLATLLGGNNSHIDLRGHGPERMRRLRSQHSLGLAPLHTLSPGELAAMSWLAESWTREDALTRDPTRVLAVDFDAFLADVEGGIGRVLQHFDRPHGPALLSQLGRSPVLGRYSKAPEYAYTATQRAEVLRESRRLNRDEIRKGMQWLERQARSDNRVSRVLNQPG